MLNCAINGAFTPLTASTLEHIQDILNFQSSPFHFRRLEYCATKLQTQTIELEPLLASRQFSRQMPQNTTHLNASITNYEHLSAQKRRSKVIFIFPPTKVEQIHKIVHSHSSIESDSFSQQSVENNSTSNKAEARLCKRSDKNTASGKGKLQVYATNLNKPSKSHNKTSVRKVNRILYQSW